VTRICAPLMTERDDIFFTRYEIIDGEQAKQLVEKVYAGIAKQS